MVLRTRKDINSAKCKKKKKKGREREKIILNYRNSANRLFGL